MPIDKDKLFLEVARTLSKATSCIRRGVGCVLVDENYHVLATGYNGVAKGQPHCNRHDEFHETGFPHACEGAFAKSGTELHKCEAIHAEQNALLQCADVSKIAYCYVTASPCMHCMKLLMNTGCKIIYTDEIYSDEPINYWLKSGRGLFVLSSGGWV